MDPSELYAIYDRDPEPIVDFIEYLRDVYRLPSPGHILDAMGVSERTVRKWVNRCQADGVSSLADRSSRPRHSPRRLAAKVARRIERLRRRRYTGLRIAEELGLAVSTVSLWLRRLGLGRLRQLEPRPVVVRYEKKRPGELLHLDTKKLGRIQGVGHRIHGNRRRRARGVGWEFLHVCIDDATRVAYAEVLPDEKAVSATAFVQRAIAWFADHDVLVERIMTDNGTCYRSHRFNGALAAHGVKHIYTRPYRPQTNGKAERFIQTAKREWAFARAYRTSTARTLMLPGFLSRYNRRRPHRGIGNVTKTQLTRARLWPSALRLPPRRESIGPLCDTGF